jgi:hypothetical protein
VSGGRDDRPVTIALRERRPRPSRRRVWAARVVAVAADVVQFALLPFVIGGVLSPVDDAIDVVTGVALTALLGFHWVFLPTFVAKIVPFVDMVPSWTMAVFITTRGQGGRDVSERELSAEAGASKGQITSDRSDASAR